MARLHGFLLALFLASAPGSARADLGNDVERLVLTYSALGHVTRRPPRLLERGQGLPIVLPTELLDPATPRCATLVLLGTTGTHFQLDARAARLAAAEGEEIPEGSLAGAFSMTRCGKRKPELQTLAIQMRSPRAVIEMMVVSSEGPLPPLTHVLPHRDPGPMATTGGPGPRPRALPLPLRLRALQAKAAREGALEVARQELSATPFGMGAALITLSPGCHRFDLLSDEDGARSADIDLEITRAEDGGALAEDHSESSDAAALVCVGAPLAVSLRFAGASPFAKLELFRARWDLEEGLPRRFGADARARMSAVLRDQRMGLGGAVLVDSCLGAQGDTGFSVEVEPFACYVALAVGLRGEAAMLAVAARTSRGDTEGRMPADVPGTAVAFCAGPEDRASIEVEARGLAMVWMTAVFQTGRLRPGTGDE